MGAAFDLTIHGAKGGGKGGGGGSVRTPVEEANTLQSNTTVHLTEILSEGEIKGPVKKGLQSLYLDGTPAENEDGTSNFPGLSAQYRLGLPSQPPVDGLREIGREVPYSRKVCQKDGPVIFTVEDPDADGVLVKIRIPALCKYEMADQGTLGDAKKTGVSFSIHHRADGGVWQDARVSTGWVDCGATTKEETTQFKVSVTAQTPVAQKSGAKWIETTKEVSVHYREKGTASWIKLGAQILKSELQQVPGGTLYTSAPVTKTLSWTSGTLPSAQYEIKCVEGSLASASCYTFVPISYFDKCTSPYEAQFRVNLDSGGAPWQIKVTRITPDATTSNLQNETYVSGYTVLYYDRLSYPNTAYVHLTVDTSQFGTSVPAREFDLYGKIVNVPSNYDPYTRKYSGLWDGSFKREWTDNPAWVFYDLLTNTRYGLGRVIPREKIDVASLYKIATYCDELVPDGFGGMEPRYTFNGVLNVEKPAVTWLQEIATNFNALIYQANGNIVLWQDRPEPPCRVVAPENIVNGDIEYQGTAKTARFSQVQVTWNDPEDGYKLAIEPAEDQEMIRTYGIIKKVVSGIGITSRGQARRKAEWTLHTNKAETQIASLSTGLDCHEVRPGKVLAAHDPNRAGIRSGGRIKEPGTKELVLDTPFHFEPGVYYWLIATMPDGSIDEQAIVNPCKETDTITLASQLAQKPLRGAMWTVKSSTLEPQHIRVLGVKEEGNVYSFVGAVMSRNKWDFIEKGWAFDDPPISQIPTGPLAAPVNLTVREYLYRSGSGVRSAATFSWQDKDGRAAAFYVRATPPGEKTAQDYGSTRGPSRDIFDVSCGEWSFQVCSVDALGRTSPWANLKAFLNGMYAPPADVTDFRIAINGQNALLTWGQVPDLDLSHYELRFSRNREATWEQAGELVKHSEGCSCMVPAMNGAYFIKAVDLVGMPSVNATSVFTDYVGLENINLVETIEEHGEFTGTHEGTRRDPGGLCLGVVGDALEKWPALSELGSLEPGVGEFSLYGEYYLSQTIDLGGIYPCKLSADISAYGRSRGNYIKSWPALSAVGPISGANPGLWSAALQYSTSKKKEPVGEQDWSEWAPFFSGDVTARNFRFRAILDAKNSGVTPVVTRLSVTVDMPDRTARGEDILCPENGLTVDFDPPFILPFLGVCSLHGLGDAIRVVQLHHAGCAFSADVAFADGAILVTFYLCNNAILPAHSNIATVKAHIAGSRDPDIFFYGCLLLH